jgi:translation initiation factor IF-2
MRVYELAKNLGVSSKEIIEKLNKLGYQVKGNFSSVDPEVMEKVTAELKVSGSTKATSARVKVKDRKKTKKPRGKPKKMPVKAEEKTQRVTAKPVLKVPQAATVKEFAELVARDPIEIIKMLMRLGEMVTITQSLSSEAIHVLAEELGYEAKIVSPEEIEVEAGEEEKVLLPRPPVVTVMGHVDHGKTSLLDAIRKTNVIAEEVGGITQHIGAYQVIHGGKKITFIDTPGHEAFTAMRARGAQVTDIAVLVVAADDGVMPQTIEAIDHARAANVPIIVAINKIDLPEANPDRVRQELTDHQLVPEEWGGDTVFVEVSAKKRINIEELLEMILLVAEMQELKANLQAKAHGVCIEAKLDKGRGPVATVLINKGILRVGDAFVAGTAYGKVRALIDDKGKNLKEAKPSAPVEVLGFASLPQAGDELRVVADEKVARKIAEERALKKRLIEAETRRHVTLEDLHERIREGEVKELNLVVKADAQGSVEAIKDALYKLSTDEVKLNIIHSGVGSISETDVMLASASDAIIIGFNVRPDAKAKEMAHQEKVDIRSYRVIYQVVEDIESALAGLLAPEIEEVEEGRAEVRQTFRIPKVGVVAGCYVSDGEINRSAQARLVRDGQIVYEGTIASLKRYKDDVRSVKAGFECGIGLQGFQDIKEGDIIETYRVIQRERRVGPKGDKE